MLRGLVGDIFAVGREWASIFDERVEKLTAQKDRDRLRTEINKEIASDLLDVYIDKIGVDKDLMFSQSLRKALSQTNP